MVVASGDVSPAPGGELLRPERGAHLQGAAAACRQTRLDRGQDAKTIGKP